MQGQNWNEADSFHWSKLVRRALRGPKDCSGHPSTSETMESVEESPRSPRSSHAAPAHFCNWRSPTSLLVTQGLPPSIGLCICTCHSGFPVRPHSTSRWAAFYRNCKRQWHWASGPSMHQLPKPKRRWQKVMTAQSHQEANAFASVRDSL